MKNIQNQIKCFWQRNYRLQPFHCPNILGSFENLFYLGKWSSPIILWANHVSYKSTRPHLFGLHVLYFCIPVFVYSHISRREFLAVVKRFVDCKKLYFSKKNQKSRLNFELKSKAFFNFDFVLLTVNMNNCDGFCYPYQLMVSFLNRVTTTQKFHPTSSLYFRSVKFGAH